MRKINYKIKNENGAEFFTSSYKEATRNGNHIEETYFTEVDERTEKQKERAKKHAERIHEILKAKRG